MNRVPTLKIKKAAIDLAAFCIAHRDYQFMTLSASNTISIIPL